MALRVTMAFVDLSDHVADASGRRFMRRALALASRGRGRVEPNPMVGALIVRGDRILAEGYHRHYGGPHAEVEAISAARCAGRGVAGADMYVTLEPCCHTGKTPPCTDQIVAAGLRRVFVAMVDPFEQVAGAGIEALRCAGIEVHVGIGREEAQRLNAPFIKRVSTGLPWIIAKWAQTIDGRIATAGGDSRWISGEASRRVVHRLRARVDVICCGAGTAMMDDPRLTARGARPRRIARRLIIDAGLRLRPGAAVLKDVPRVPLMVAVAPDLLQERPPRLEALAARGVAFLPLGERDEQLPGRFSLRAVFESLAARYEATNVLVEGGGGLMGHLLAEGLLDECMVFIAPKLMADADAVPALRGLHRERIADLSPLKLQRHRRLGDDVMLEYRM